ncbi:Homeobox-like_domain superfamily [Hexamita inflata]|uniref:Homeobox-like domain superfamily n=1 Tax=Hexamita inflata TaxID=28002 RepID=A0AA86Q7M7_9EUKA|nr:Homeobox-like domain superfamily [Hexamita inflata]
MQQQRQSIRWTAHEQNVFIELLKRCKQDVQTLTREFMKQCPNRTYGQVRSHYYNEINKNKQRLNSSPQTEPQLKQPQQQLLQQQILQQMQQQMYIQQKMQYGQMAVNIVPQQCSSFVQTEAKCPEQVKYEQPFFNPTISNFSRIKESESAMFVIFEDK